MEDTCTQRRFQTRLKRELESLGSKFYRSSLWSNQRNKTEKHESVHRGIEEHYLHKARRKPSRDFDQDKKVIDKQKR